MTRTVRTLAVFAVAAAIFTASPSHAAAAVGGKSGPGTLHPTYLVANVCGLTSVVLGNLTLSAVPDRLPLCSAR
ncbi:hypothetical protein [Glycomyces paridis]|uniref:Uncharacterized protein n=1 Tax=Glycomyces paridis TaxID=2126555 RepID=A0A4S8P8B6_9ACTN|nr:hypothetical protein [Glycomyces paridis]THV26457.1 hypothetical protein E9998_18015 [Glycomyces paridis]